uniref:Uncharacterized protein n=1 Tax=Oryza brachyantha TaxID=4533 RepID=J3NDF3_ORYBR
MGPIRGKIDFFPSSTLAMNPPLPFQISLCPSSSTPSRPKSCLLSAAHALLPHRTCPDPPPLECFETEEICAAPYKPAPCLCRVEWFKTEEYSSSSRSLRWWSKQLGAF